MDYPGYDRQLIKDYNSEGFDSVDSYDFEPGFGCVPALVEKPQPLPPPMPPLDPGFVERCRWWMMTEEEKLRIEDEYLKQFNL